MADLPDYYTMTTMAEAEAARFKGGAFAARPAVPTARDIYYATDTKVLYICVVDGVWTGFDASILVQGILTLYANLAGGGFQIKNIADPTLAQDAATKAWVEALGAIYLLLTGGTMTGAIAMGAHKITGLAAPTLANDAVRKVYADGLITTHAGLTTGIHGVGAETIASEASAIAAVEAAGLDLASGKNIKVVSALTANRTWSGLTTILTAGENLVFGNACYLGADLRLHKTDADEAATMPVMCLATETIYEDGVGEVLLQGFLRYDTWTFVPGKILFAGVTPGAISETKPVGSGDQVQVIGIASALHILYFNPSFELVEIS